VTGIETNSVVDNPKRYSRIIGTQLYLHVLGLAMGNDVMHRFLGDAI
jgi:hypothetical protein